MKVCSKCKEEKEYSFFCKDKSAKDCYSYVCRQCIKKYNDKTKEIRSIKSKQYYNNNISKIKKYRDVNKKYISEKNKVYYQQNKEKLAKYSNEYYLENKYRVLKRQKEYYELNKEIICSYKKQYAKINSEKNKEYQKKYYAVNKRISIIKNNEYTKNRKQTDLVFKFKMNTRTLIGNSFKRGSNQFKKNTKTESILGCTIEEFRLYIESKFTEGMSFENHGKNGWHLDHIIPISIAQTEEEVIKLNHYTNFQPLWAEDNIRKSNKI